MKLNSMFLSIRSPAVIRQLVDDLAHRVAGGGSSTSSPVLRRRRRLNDDVLTQHVDGSLSTTSSRVARPAAARLHPCTLHGQRRLRVSADQALPISADHHTDTPTSSTYHAWILNHVKLPIQSEIASLIQVHATPFD
jgi:hypothetical protein